MTSDLDLSPDFLRSLADDLDRLPADLLPDAMTLLDEMCPNLTIFSWGINADDIDETRQTIARDLPAATRN